MRWGIVDVLGFMALVDSSVMDFWEEYNTRFPLNDSRERWMQHAVMAMQLKALYNFQLQSAGVNAEPFSINDFLPQRYQIEIKPQSAERQEEALRKGLGL